SPSEPDDMVSISMGFVPRPSRMIEPLPKARSIWESAASSAFVLSIAPPSTTRSVLLCAIALLLYGRDSPGQQTPPAQPDRSGCESKQRTRFVRCSQYVLCRPGCCPNLTLGVLS